MHKNQHNRPLPSLVHQTENEASCTNENLSRWYSIMYRDKLWRDLGTKSLWILQTTTTTVQQNIQNTYKIIQNVRNTRERRKKNCEYICDNIAQVETILLALCERGVQARARDTWSLLDQNRLFMFHTFEQFFFWKEKKMSCTCMSLILKLTAWIHTNTYMTSNHLPNHLILLF